jgi:hypothetical protein
MLTRFLRSRLLILCFSFTSQTPPVALHRLDKVLSLKHASLSAVHSFLTAHHDLYSASGLTKRATAQPTGATDFLLASYGARRIASQT